MSLTGVGRNEETTMERTTVIYRVDDGRTEYETFSERVANRASVRGARVTARVE